VRAEVSPEAGGQRSLFRLSRVPTGIGDFELLGGTVLIEPAGSVLEMNRPLTQVRTTREMALATLARALSPDGGEGRILKERLGVIGEMFEAGGVFLNQLLERLAGAGGGFEGDFLRQKERGAGIDDGAARMPEHFVEGKVGESGGFAGLPFPKERPDTSRVFDKGGECGFLIGTAGHKILNDEF
jgi:hypothetical protein